MTQATLAAPTSPFDFADFDRYVMGTYARFPIAIDRGRGCRLWDSTGKEYLDFVAGIATCTLGHAHPVMIEALSEQIHQLHHVSNLYYLPAQGALAKWLVEHSCGDKVFFCNSGAEANEAAIKLARKYAHQNLGISDPVILTAHSSFHGRTLATITATGQPKYQKHFTPLPTGFDYIPYNDLAGFHSVLNQYRDRVCAVLLEPLQGEGGVCPGDRDYFQALRSLCDERGILLILDEVQVGMGRSGKLWGYENLGIEPDIFTTAKGLGGGFPIGAMVCKAKCDVFAPGDHASTFGGNPLACHGALKVCETIVNQNLLAKVQARGEQLHQGLAKIAAEFPHHIEQVRGWGLIQGLVLRQDSPLTARDIVQSCIEQGLLLVPAGVKVVRFVPPLIVEATEIDQALDRVRQSLLTALK